MKVIPVLFWALLYAAPVFSQQALWSDPRISTDGLKWFQLVESESEVRKYLGQPAIVADFGEYRSWQYQIGEVEHDDFSHALVFRKSDGKLVSVSRTYNPERSVDSFSRRARRPCIGSVLQGSRTSRCVSEGSRVDGSSSQSEHPSRDRPLDSWSLCARTNCPTSIPGWQKT